VLKISCVAERLSLFQHLDAEVRTRTFDTCKGSTRRECRFMITTKHMALLANHHDIADVDYHFAAPLIDRSLSR
jgi:hypothetical protein